MKKKKLGILTATVLIITAVSMPVYAQDGDIYDTSTTPVTDHGSIGNLILNDKSTLFNMITNMNNYGYEVSGKIYNLSDVNTEFNKNPNETQAALQTDAQENLPAVMNVPTASVAVTSVSLNKTTDTLRAPGFDSLTATISPSNATNLTVTWQSSNTQVAFVANGLIIGVRPGNAVITVTTADGNFTASCNVTVTAAANSNQ